MEERLELQILLLSGGYQWDGNPPDAEADVIALVKAFPIPLPTVYLDLLRLSDGGDAQLSDYPSAGWRKKLSSFLERG